VRAILIADDLTGACDAGVAFPGAAVVLQDPPPAAEVLVYSTDSRADGAELAAAKVAALCAKLPAAAILYKKIDSMLRGNVAAEVFAVPRRPIVVCPAFPEQGRTVVNGRAEPAGVDLRSLFGSHPEVEIADAATSADLHRIARDALARSPVPLLAGSAGLARELSLILGFQRPAPPLLHGGARPILCVGSDHQVTLAQVDYLRANGTRPCHIISINPRLPDPKALQHLINLVSGSRDGGLFLTGGDTACMVFAALGVRAIRLSHEILPGVPAGRMEGGAANGVAVVTKSGGFGGPDTLVRIVEALSGENRLDEPTP